MQFFPLCFKTAESFDNLDNILRDTRSYKPAGIGFLAPNQLLILNWVKGTNLMSKSLQNVLTNFLILHCVVMEKGPLYGNLKYKQFSLRVTL